MKRAERRKIILEQGLDVSANYANKYDLWMR